MSNLTYIRHPNLSCAGNPLIEVMGYPHTPEQIHKLCDSPFIGGTKLDDVPIEYHDYYTRSTIDNLAETYVVQDEAYDIYDQLRRMIEAGYKHRNPLNKKMEKMLVAIERDKDDPIAAKNLKVAFGNAIDSMLTANASYLLCGLSGRGKTTLILRLLKEITKYYKHSKYTKSDGSTVDFKYDQQVYLYVQLHERRGQKALLKTVLAALDEETGENYEYNHRNSSIEQLITAIRKAMILHNVGVLIIDEAQNFSKTPTQLTISPNERTSIKFVEEIFNRIGVPLFLIGTVSTFKLFGNNMKIGRRITNNGSKTLLSCPLEESFWQRLCDQICRTELLKGQVTKLDTIKRHLHLKTQGIPAIAVSLVRATLCHLTKLKPEQQDLGIRTINYVFEQQFKVLKAPLRALKNEQYHKYEDFDVLALLEIVDAEEALEEKQSQQEPLEEQPQNSSESTPKPKRKKYKPRSTSTVKTVDVETAEKMGVTSIMSMLKSQKEKS